MCARFTTRVTRVARSLRCSLARPAPLPRAQPLLQHPSRAFAGASTRSLTFKPRVGGLSLAFKPRAGGLARGFSGEAAKDSNKDPANAGETAPGATGAAGEAAAEAAETDEVEEETPFALNVIKIKLTELHEGMEVAKLTEWFKPVGSQLKVGEALCEMETEVAFIEFDCQTSGFLAAQLVEADPDRKVEVGDVIALVVHREDEVGYVQQKLKESECVEDLLEAWRKD